VNGHDGSNVWQFVEQAGAAELHREPFVDIFSGQFIQDVDGDGLPDVLAAHTQDTPEGTKGSCYVDLWFLNSKTVENLSSIIRILNST
jgi:hypothetical protein